MLKVKVNGEWTTVPDDYYVGKDYVLTEDDIDEIVEKVLEHIIPLLPNKDEVEHGS